MFEFIPPGSKSHANRCLILAALADGKSFLRNFPFCEDTIYMIRGLRKLGVKIDIDGDNVIVNGNGGKFSKKKTKIYCGNAGTTFRFLTALSVLNHGEVIITGSKRMLQRPIGDLVEALKQLNVKIDSKNGFPPVKIAGGNFSPKKVIINPKISSQFLSALLLIMPVLGKDFTVESDNDLSSLPYVKMTLHTLNQFGVKVYQQNFKTFYLRSDLKLKPAEINIERDSSSATYFFGSAAVLKKSIKVYGINKNSLQADIKFIKILKRMGCTIRWGKNYVILTGKKLKGVSVDMNDAPDSVPALAVVSIFAEGKTLIKNIENLRYKESDRISALSTELKKIGVMVNQGKDFLEIIPSESYVPAEIETYNDHRLAMSFAIVQLKIPGIKIKNPECVKKSFTNFWSEFNKLREAYKI